MADPAVSRWFRVDPVLVQGFADLTQDWQPIHLDRDAAAKTPFGQPIAHGFLILSMLSAMQYDALGAPDPSGHSVNYGFDRIRFVSPVPVGSEVRGVFRRAAQDTPAAGVTAVTHDVTIEIRGQEKPALVALWRTRHYASDPA